MSPASKKLAEGSTAFMIGLAFTLFGDKVPETPDILPLPKVGMVLMAASAIAVLVALVQKSRESSSRGEKSL